jgi:carboxyl-terminal processing protease
LIQILKGAAFYLRRARFLILIGIVAGLSGGPAVSAQNPDLRFDQARLFDEVWALVKEHFYDSEKVGDSWDAIHHQFRLRAVAANTHREFAAILNEMLATQNTSHTAYYSAAHQRRSQILGIFEGLVPSDKEELFFADSIGIEVEGLSGKTFIRAVYDGHAAAKAGLLFGDEIVTVDGKPFHEINSFRNKSEVTVQFRRKEGEPVSTIQVPVSRLDGRKVFETAMRSSARILERDQKKVAYIHVWSYAGSRYQDLLRDLLLFGDLKEANALILDLRDGWGGASMEYLNLFREPIAEVVSRPRGEAPTNFNGVWNKPVVLLVNRRSTSGKELFTYGFKKLGLGEVVGETTAGAMVAGRAFLLSNHDILYLAVSDISVDGLRLEGQGVAPTIFVERPIPYACGADPQLENAIETAIEKLTR